MSRRNQSERQSSLVAFSNDAQQRFGVLQLAYLALCGIESRAALCRACGFTTPLGRSLLRRILRRALSPGPRGLQVIPRYVLITGARPRLPGPSRAEIMAADDSVRGNRQPRGLRLHGLRHRRAVRPSQEGLMCETQPRPPRRVVQMRGVRTTATGPHRGAYTAHKGDNRPVAAVRFAKHLRQGLFVVGRDRRQWAGQQRLSQK